MCIEDEKFCEEATKLLNSYREKIEHLEINCTDPMEESFKTSMWKNRESGILDLLEKLGFGFTYYNVQGSLTQKYRYKVFRKEEKK